MKIWPTHSLGYAVHKVAAPRLKLVLEAANEAMNMPDPRLETRRAGNLSWELYQALGDLYQRYQKFHVCKECSDICPAARAAELIKISSGESGRMSEMAYEYKHKILVEYLTSKVDEGDWHGVCDAANDLRVMEAEKRARDELIKLNDDTQAYASRIAGFKAALQYPNNRQGQDYSLAANSQSAQHVGNDIEHAAASGPSFTINQETSGADPYRFSPDKPA